MEKDYPAGVLPSHVGDEALEAILADKAGDDHEMIRFRSWRSRKVGMVSGTGASRSPQETCRSRLTAHGVTVSFVGGPRDGESSRLARASRRPCWSWTTQAGGTSGETGPTGGRRARPGFTIEADVPLANVLPVRVRQPDLLPSGQAQAARAQERASGHNCLMEDAAPAAPFKKPTWMICAGTSPIPRSAASSSGPASRTRGPCGDAGRKTAG